MIQYSPSQAMFVFRYDIVSSLEHFVRINLEVECCCSLVGIQNLKFGSIQDTMS